MRKHTNAATPAGAHRLHPDEAPDKSKRPRRPLPRYVRDRDLPRLLPMLPDEAAINSLADHAKLVGMLRRALRIERRRGLAGDWTYDLARHAHLLEAYRIELDALHLRRGRRPARTTKPR